MSLSLFNIAQEHRALVARLMDLDLDEQTMKDTLEGESYPLEQKAQNVTFVIRSCQFEQAAIDNEIERLVQLRARIAAREQGLREYVQTCMQVAGVTKISAGTFSLSLRKNPPSAEIFDERQIPAEYMRTPEPKPPVSAPDKKAILAALKDGLVIPGAKFAPEKSRLVIE